MSPQKPKQHNQRKNCSPVVEILCLIKFKKDNLMLSPRYDSVPSTVSKLWILLLLSSSSSSSFSSSFSCWRKILLVRRVYDPRCRSLLISPSAVTHPPPPPRLTAKPTSCLFLCLRFLAAVSVKLTVLTSKAALFYQPSTLRCWSTIQQFQIWSASLLDLKYEQPKNENCSKCPIGKTQ